MKIRRLAGLIPILLATAAPSVAVSAEGTNAWIIAIDKSGSMDGITMHCGVPMSRCSCSREMARAKLDEIFFQDPAASVAVVGFETDEFLIQDFTNNRTLLDLAVAGSCGGMTDLADGACLSGNLLAADFGGEHDSRTLFLMTDGGENHSEDLCGGPGTSVLLEPPYDAGSWQNAVYANLVGNAVVDVGYFGEMGPLRSGDSAGGTSPQLNLPDNVFLQALAADSGGTFTDFECDDADACTIAGQVPVFLGSGPG
jgi:hypothetical protein